MTKKLKELYSSPATTVLVVRFEDCLLNASPRLGIAGQAGANDTYNAYDEDF